MHHPVLENVPPFTSASTSGRMVFRSREVPVNFRSRHHSWLSNCRLVRSREHLVVRETNEFCLRTPDGTADFRIVHLALQRLLCRLFMKKLSDHRTRKATSEGCTSFFCDWWYLFTASNSGLLFFHDSIFWNLEFRIVLQVDWRLSVTWSSSHFQPWHFQIFHGGHLGVSDLLN